jgi:hypothetical protein
MSDLLRELNFRDLISVGVTDIDAYTFDKYRQNGFEHKPIDGYCTACEEKGFNISKDDESYQLTNISHGAHTSDFLLALKDKIDISGWHQQPVMFVYETPSKDYRVFKEVSYKGFNKHPSKDWYWIHTDQEPVSYPEKFKGGVYGEFVLSALMTFRLANAYITNLVKCGMNDKQDNFKGLLSFKNECISECYSRFLEKEIGVLKPVIIFAVGSAVEGQVKSFVKDTIYVQQLPHPAGRQRGFRDEYYKVLYFWLVVRGLHKTGVIQTDEAGKLATLFLAKY